MATATETYSVISTTECQPNKPLTSELALRWRANLLASFQAAAGAPRLAVGALERLNAGDTQRALNANSFDSNSATYVTPWSFMVLQGGTVRIKWDQSTADSAVESTARVAITRAGTTTGYGENVTNSETPVTASVDITVQPGDVISFQHKTADILDTVTIENLIVATGGADLWPTEEMAGFINANTSLT